MRSTSNLDSTSKLGICRWHAAFYTAQCKISNWIARHSQRDQSDEIPKEIGLLFFTNHQDSNPGPYDNKFYLKKLWIVILLNLLNADFTKARVWTTARDSKSCWEHPSAFPREQLSLGYISSSLQNTSNNLHGPWQKLCKVEMSLYLFAEILLVTC